MANKKTKKDYINELLAMAEVQKNKECVAFLKKELETLSNRKSSGKKAKEKLAEQGIIMDIIRDFLEDHSDKSYTATEILRTAFKDEDVSIQRVTAMLKKLIESGAVTKTVEKKTSYFQIADVDDEEEIEAEETETAPEEIETETEINEKNRRG